LGYFHVLKPFDTLNVEFAEPFSRGAHFELTSFVLFVVFGRLWKQDVSQGKFWNFARVSDF
jgi:hypothetical protein